MSFEVIVILSFSVLIAAGISFAKFSKIRSVYYPFIYVIWLASLNEIISYMMVRNGMYNIINSNIYCLLESLLLLWFFKNIGNFQFNKWMYHLLASGFVISWILDNFIFHSLTRDYSSWFIIVYSFPVVILGINAINRLLIKERELLRNPTFLICIGLIVFFTYRIVVEVFWVYGLQSSGSFANKVYNILSIINLLCNLIYALAILWMQKKQAFTLQY